MMIVMGFAQNITRNQYNNIVISMNNTTHSAAGGTLVMKSSV